MLPLIATGLLATSLFLVLRPHAPTYTVSSVVRDIHETALAAGRPHAPLEAGRIGPWQVSAERVDPITSQLVNLNLDSGDLLLSAERATVHVDAAADTFSFELFGVVFLRVPKELSDDEVYVHRMDHYVLGPAPFGADIVPDGRGAAPTDDDRTTKPWPPITADAG